MLSFKSFFGLFISLIMSFIGLFQGIGTKPTDEMPVAPDDFVPAVRFAVCSDSHNRNDRVAEMIDRCYELYENDTVYSGFDLFVFCGDMTEAGAESDMVAFKETVDAHIKGDTQALSLLGNHEMKNSNARASFEEIFKETPNRHITINGFHFISVSYSYDDKYYPSVAKWAGNEVDSALSDAPDLPIFTFQHPHNFGTVYGSTIWGSPQLASAWRSNSNVVNFSGHSHYPMNDPRSIWQGSYTALGCGGMNYFELEKDFIAGEFPEGNDRAAQFYVVEADLDGSVKILCYDLDSDGFFGETYYIEDVNNPECFAYTYNNRRNYDDKPVWDDNTQINLVKNENDEYIINFNEATDKLIVQNYKIKITSYGFPIYSETHVSDYFLVNDNDTATFNLGQIDLKSGKEYKVEITAVNAYSKLSEPISMSFTA